MRSVAWRQVPGHAVPPLRMAGHAAVRRLAGAAARAGKEFRPNGGQVGWDAPKYARKRPRDDAPPGGELGWDTPAYTHKRPSGPPLPQIESKADRAKRKLGHSKGHSKGQSKRSRGHSHAAPHGTDARRADKPQDQLPSRSRTRSARSGKRHPEKRRLNSAQVRLKAEARERREARLAEAREQRAAAKGAAAKGPTSAAAKSAAAEGDRAGEGATDGADDDLVEAPRPDKASLEREALERGHKRAANHAAVKAAIARAQALKAAAQAESERSMRSCVSKFARETKAGGGAKQVYASRASNC